MQFSVNLLCFFTVLCEILQETDKLKDDDLYKLLQELKKPSSCPSKKLKNVNGSLKLDISPCPTDEVKQCLTADLIPLLSYDIAGKIFLYY